MEADKHYAWFEAIHAQNILKRVPRLKEKEKEKIIDSSRHLDPGASCLLETILALPSFFIILLLPFQGLSSLSSFFIL